MPLRRVTAVLAIAFLLLAGALPARAEPALRLPLDCRVNETCWIQNYVDADPAKGAVLEAEAAHGAVFPTAPDLPDQENGGADEDVPLPFWGAVEEHGHLQ